MPDRIGDFVSEASAFAEVNREKVHGRWPGVVVHEDGSASLYENVRWRAPRRPAAEVIEEDEKVLCFRCGRPVGDDYHIVGAEPETFSCDDCWDERLR